MKVISNNHTVLEANVLVETVDSVLGLILESRSGTKGKPNVRNPDYLLSLECIIDRLKSKNITEIEVYLVSAEAMKIWSMSNRKLLNNGNDKWSLNGAATDIRAQICRAQTEKKKNQKTKGGNPTKRILIWANNTSESEWKDIVLHETLVPSISSDEIELKEPWDPENAESAKEKTVRSIAIRRGQKKFRDSLMKAYNGRCAVTGTNISQTLEAAHIIPYHGIATNNITNGILLRADIHILFDLQLLGIDENYILRFSPTLNYSKLYNKFNGKKINLPDKESERPSIEVLKSRPLPEA